jgi:hypothetical protein
MFNISQYFHSKQPELKNNLYKDTFLDILIKRRNKMFTVYGIINMYSLNSKKKIDDIMNDKKDILEAINQLKNNENIIYYYYCKDDKLYYLFEYTITPAVRNIRNNNNIDIAINDIVDGYFALNIDIDTIKNVLFDPKKYINFCPKNTTINGQNILKQLILLNDEKTLNLIIEKYNIHITDTVVGCGIKYKDLLDVAISVNNSNVVNVINKCYYEKKQSDFIKTELKEEKESVYKKYFYYLDIASRITGTLALPMMFYITFFAPTC